MPTIARDGLRSLIIGKFPSAGELGVGQVTANLVFEEERGKSNGVWNAPMVHQELSNCGHSAWKLDGLLSLSPPNLMVWAPNLGSHTCKLK